MTHDDDPPVHTVRELLDVPEGPPWAVWSESLARAMAAPDDAADPDPLGIPTDQSVRPFDDDLLTGFDAPEDFGPEDPLEDLDDF